MIMFAVRQHARHFFPRPVSPFFLRRQFSLWNLFAKRSEEKVIKNKQPLSALFQELVFGGGGGGMGNDELKSQGDPETLESRERLMALEEQVRSLSKEEACPRPVGKFFSKDTSSSGEEIRAKRSLSAIFASENTKRKSTEPIDLGKSEPKVHKLLSPDMQAFAKHLYLKGYFKGANFIRRKKFDSILFEDTYASLYFRSAAANFGKAHTEVARWLSTSNLKKVALSGCPSQDKKSAYAAKHLRAFFKIEEEVVCQKCIVKNSCKYANKKHWEDSGKLNMLHVTRVLVDYGLINCASQQFVVPGEVQDSVDQLLKEIISISSNGSTGHPGTPYSHQHHN